MITIDLARHAESTWVEQADADPVKRFGGRMTEVELSTTGIWQAQQLGKFAKDHGLIPAAYYSSDAIRAQQTYRYSAAEVGVFDQPHIDPRFQELTWGEWEGQPRDIANVEPYASERSRKGLDFAPPGGESYNDVRVRVWQAFNELVALWPPNSYLWVHTHRNVIKAVVAPWFGWTLDQTMAATVDVVSLTRIQIDTNELRTVDFNIPTLSAA